VAASIRNAQDQPFKRANIIGHPMRDASYPGNADRAMNMYHMFSGRALPAASPVDSLVGEAMPPLMPLAQMVAPRSTRLSGLPKLIPMDAEIHSDMPRLVPMDAELLGCCHGEKKDEKKKTKKPVVEEMTNAQIGDPMPKLVPLSSLTYKDALLGARARGGQPNRIPQRTKADGKVSKFPGSKTGSQPSRTRYAGMGEPLFASGYDDAPTLADFL
jgi:hypothetical protein